MHVLTSVCCHCGLEVEKAVVFAHIMAANLVEKHFDQLTHYPAKILQKKEEKITVTLL